MKTVIYFKTSDRPADHKKLDGIRDCARRFGWNLQVVEPVSNDVAVRQVLNFWRPDGCIVSCGSGKNDIPSSAFGKVPIVFLDRPLTKLGKRDTYVCHDSAESTRLASRELLNLNLSHYAYVHWDVPTKWDAERARAFAEIMRLHGKSHSEFRPSAPTEAPQRFIRSLVKWLMSVPLPCGVFAAADQTAALVIEACRLAQLAVPRDIAIISVNNDIEICENTHPTLSSVDPDFTAAGRLAAETLLQRMTGQLKASAHVIYKPSGLVRRKSTMRFALRDKAVMDALERIRNEACSGLTAREILATFPCSRRMAEIRFHALTGKSVLEAILDVRLAKAKELLARPAYDLEAIANFCGYKNLNAFSMFFKSAVGENPSRWRITAQT